MARKKLTIDKYNYGSYVVRNQQMGYEHIPSQDIGAGMVSGASSLGSLGSSIAGPLGGAIGAAGGFLIGGMSASAKNKKIEKRNKANISKSQALFANDFAGALNTVNENPYGTYQDGGDVKKDPLADNKQFYTNYLLSPNYKSRLEGMGYNDPFRVISDRLSNINQTGIVNIDNWGSRYNPDNKTIIVDPTEIKKYGDNRNTVISHEMAHAAGAVGSVSNDNRLNNNTLNKSEIEAINLRNNQVGQGHDGRASEFKADMDALRFMLKRDGIYDTGTEEFNKKILNKAKSKYSKDTYIKRLFDRASDDDLIYLMNNIASTSNNTIPIAADGGDIIGATINIEKGEILVDPQTGKIKREFSGINPETGGLYEPHAKGRKKDTPNNIVTAEEGSFVITKQKAKEYKDAIKNNDKLAQNSIMHNIRNKKRQSMKFAEGGLVDPPINLFPTVDWQQIEKLKRPTQTGTNQLSGIISNNNSITESSRFNPNKITYGDPNRSVSSLTNKTANAQAGFNWGDLMTALPAVSNLIQGFSSPNYMKSGPSYVNPYRNQILGNMPRDIDYTPLFNRIYRDRNTAYNVIDETTNSSAVARANKLNIMANTQRGIQDTYFQGEDYNNRTRAQRAGIYSNLAGMEADQFNRDRQFNYGIGALNRQMQEGRRQQINYGLSQLGQLYNQRNLNTQLENRDRDLMRLLPQIYPALEYYLDNYRTGGKNG